MTMASKKPIPRLPFREAVANIKPLRPRLTVTPMTIMTTSTRWIA